MVEHTSGRNKQLISVVHAWIWFSLNRLILVKPKESLVPSKRSIFTSAKNVKNMHTPHEILAALGNFFVNY